MASKRPSGGQRTAAARQAAWKARATEAGLKKVSVVVPAEREEELKEIAAMMRQEKEKCTR